MKSTNVDEIRLDGGWVDLISSRAKRTSSIGAAAPSSLVGKADVFIFVFPRPVANYTFDGLTFSQFCDIMKKKNALELLTNNR